MKSNRYQIAVWQDFNDSYTAKILEPGLDISGFHKDKKMALLQIKRYLQKEEDSIIYSDPDFFDPEVHFYSVPIRPAYIGKDRVYTSENEISIRVPLVIGLNEDEQYLCFLPTLDIYFNYYNEDKLQELVQFYVAQAFENNTVRVIIKHLEPKTFEIEELVVQAKSYKKKNRSQTEEDYSVLKQISENLADSHLRRQYSRAWKRDSLVEELFKRIIEEESNILLLGNESCGKTSILVDAARKIEKKKGKPLLWLTNANRIIAGMKYLGEWEERFEEVIEELSEFNGILCIEKLVDLIRVGSNDPSDSIAMFLLSFMKHSEVRIIAETNTEEMEKIRQYIPGFIENFQIIDIPDLGREEHISILEQIAIQAKNNKQLDVDNDALLFMEQSFSRFFPYMAITAKVTQFIKKLILKSIKDNSYRVTKEQAIREFISLTGLPDFILREEKTIHFAELLEDFYKKIIHQEKACEKVLNSITTFKSGLNDPGKPIASYLFTGPTGVGKTQLANTLANYLFGQGSRKSPLIRIDMSEYSGYDAVNRFLIGQDGSPSEIIQKIRNYPFSVILFDEIEKADSEFFDLLLNILDEGYLMDLNGRKTWFRNSIIIMTSNIGTDKKSIQGFSQSESSLSMKDLMDFFRPEFINRIDAVVPFNSLNEGAIKKITEIELMKVNNRKGLLQRNIKITWDEAFIDFISKAGFDPKLGARPLQRCIDEYVVSSLSEYLSSNSKLENLNAFFKYSDKKVEIEYLNIPMVF